MVDADDISARLLVQTARQSGLSVIYQDLLDFGGDEFYVISEPRLVGYQFGQVLSAYQHCCPVGIVNPSGTAVLNPPMNTVIGPRDRIAILAQDDSAIQLRTGPLPVDETAIVHSVRGPQPPERTLLLGWNGRATRIIQQLDIYVTAGSTVDVVTDRRDAAAAVARVGLGLRRLTVTVTEGTPATATCWRASRSSGTTTSSCSPTTCSTRSPPTPGCSSRCCTFATCWRSAARTGRS
ncbi:hypothetical protein ACFQX7_32270 [Luedemannella flava]